MTSDQTNQILKTLYSSIKTKDTTHESANIEKLEDIILEEIYQVSKLKKTVAFFFADKGFLKHFGNLESELKKLNINVIYLLGTSDLYYSFDYQNKWFICNDMIKRIKGPAAIVVPHVIYGIPKKIKLILHDHISYVHVEADEVIKKLKEKKVEKFYDKKDMFEKISAFIPLLPFCDVILVSNNNIYNTTKEALSLFGYKSKNNFFKKTLKSYFFFQGKLLSEVSKFLNVNNYKSPIKIHNIGYLKLDKDYIKVDDRLITNSIVVATTPHKNKQNIWNQIAISESQTVELINSLCDLFPSYQIIYKPFIGVDNKYKNIVDACKKNLNFDVSYVGQDYWKLYSKAKFMITDFSSTAYTFALGCKKPVIFYSPNEKKMPLEIANSKYNIDRKNIGFVCLNIQEVLEMTNSIFEKYQDIRNQIHEFLKKENSNNEKVAIKAAKIIKDEIYNKN